MLVLADSKDQPEQFIKRMRSEGIETQIIQFGGDVDIALLFKIFRFMRKGSFDIVHTHLLHADLYGVLAAWISRVPVIISTRHNDNPFRKHYGIQLMCSLSSLVCNRIICISENVKDFVKQNEFFSLIKLKRIYYGINLCSIPKTSELREKYAWGQEVRILGIVGRLTAQKGHATLLRAMKKVLVRFKNIHLVIIGDGVLRQELKEYAKSEKIDGNIHFEGYKENAIRLMGEFDVFVHPSRWEGFGLVFLEAMASDLPIVATRVGAIPEIIEHGKTGILVEVDDSKALADGICKLLSNPSLARDMGNSGRRRLEENFTLDSMVDATTELYFRLLSKPQPN